MKYHKINSLYKRYTEGPHKGKFKNGLIGNESIQFSEDSFEHLYYNEWVGTEKIDGTNIRIYISKNEAGETIATVQGRTDNAQIPTFLQDRLDDLTAALPFDEVFENRDVILYGEGYGAKIQKGGGNYIPDGVDFILFDVFIGGMFLKREDVDKIASELGIKSVPTVFYGTLGEAENMVSKGLDSVISALPQKAEGLVLTPTGDFRNRRGGRIITKIKTVDYQ